MACVGSGAGGSQPPHRHPTRIARDCEDNDYINIEQEEEIIEQEQPTTTKNKPGGRGKSKGLSLQKQITKIGGKIQLTYEPRNGKKLRACLGKANSHYKSEIGRITRIRSRPYLAVPNWEAVDDMIKQQIFAEIASKFEPVYFDDVIHDGGVQFQKFRSELKAKVDSSSIRPCPRPDPNIEQSVWDAFLRRLQDPKFIARSATNSTNRGKKKYTATQGRRSFVNWRYHNIDPVEQPGGICPFENWRRTHQNSSGQWINDEARRDHERLLAVAREVVGDGQVNEDQEIEIFDRVFGSRRDYVVGLGPKHKKKTLLARANDHEASTSQLQQLQSQLDTVQKTLKKKEAKEKRDEKSKKKTKNVLSMLCGFFKKHNPDVEIPDIDVETSEDEGEDEEESAEDMDLD